MNQKMKRIIAAGLSAFVLIGSVPSYETNFWVKTSVSAAISSNIGTGLSWKLSNNNKTLTISGEGTMLDFRSASAVPWRGSASGITKVILEEGVSNIGAYAFAYCSSLKFITIPDTIEKIGTFAFYNSGLEMADFNMTNRVIDESAFKNTPFFKNYFTTEVAAANNIGAAKKLVGRQVVVNIFLNEISGVCTDKIRIYPSDEVNPDKEYTFFDNNKFYKIEKDKLKYRLGTCLEIGDEITVTSDFSNACATSLDEYKYFENKEWLQKDKLNRYGSNKYVTSEKMRKVISNVDEALTNLKNAAKEYNKNVEFITNKEDTNFYFTYNRWNDDFKDVNYREEVSESIKKAFIQGNEISIFQNQISNSVLENNLLGQLNKKMGKSIALDPTTTDTSEYTEYLKNKYNAEGVIYLYHFNSGTLNLIDGEAFKFTKTQMPKSIVSDEHCNIYNENPRTMMHEILHVYGALDYYDKKESGFGLPELDKTFYLYTYSYYWQRSREIMMRAMSDRIGADTAYSIGWSDNMLKDTFNVLMNRMNYSKGDVNMDGVVDIGDRILINRYNTYKEHLSQSTALTPMQKVIGEIVTP